MKNNAANGFEVARVMFAAALAVIVAWAAIGWAIHLIAEAL